jgi:hypothetical protein
LSKIDKADEQKMSYYIFKRKRKRFHIRKGEVTIMEKLLEKGLQRVKQFYIDQLVKTGNYQPKDKILNSMTISELKHIYQQEAIPSFKGTYI